MITLDSLEIKLCQLQAKIFEASVNKTNCSSPVFIRRFMYSDIAKSFDDRSYLIQSNSIDSVFDSLDEQFGKSEYGRSYYNSDVMFWIGYLYRCFSIIYGISSKQTYKLLPAREIARYYYVHHTFDIVYAAQRIAEIIGYNKESYEQKALKYMKKLFIQDRLKELINKEVTVYIDRPIGSKHPDHYKLKYTQNYGYIKELKSTDGEYQDAYVIGVDKPLKRFRGKVLAIINRKNDYEDKLIVCDVDSDYTNGEIRKMIDFVEKYYDYSIVR